MSTLRKVLDLLTPKERRLLGLVFVGVVGAALMETAGVASVMPFLTLVGDPGAVDQNWFTRWLYGSFEFATVNRFLLFMGVVVFCALVLSSTISGAVTWGLLRFGWMRNHTISRRLLASYLSRPYMFFLNQNTAALGRDILMEVQQAVNGIVVPGLEMVARAAVVLFIMGLLVVIDPVLALVVVVSLGGVYGAIYLFVRRRLLRIGRDRMEANAERFKTANEAFGGIKLLKLLGFERVFVNRYSTHSFRYSDAMAGVAVVSRVPRYALEMVAFGGVLLIVLYLLLTRGNLSEVLPLVGLYTFAAYRLMPAMQQVFHGATQVRFNLAVLDRLHRVLKVEEQTALPSASHDVEPLPFDRKLELDGISFWYPETAEPVICDVSLTVKQGSSVAFAGKTGSGKTTIADIILGLLPSTQGSMRVDGEEIGAENLRRWQRNLGYVPQDIYLQDDTIASNIAFGIANGEIDMDAVEHAARTANIHDFIVSELPEGYNTVVGERGVRLSGGERQRVGIARALYHNPAVLVLDEATSALDGATEHAVFTAIENVAQVKTLIIIAHRLTTVRNCDVVYMVDGGQIVASGTYDELVATSARFREIASVP